MFRRLAIGTLSLLTLGAAFSAAQEIDNRIADTDALKVTCPGWPTRTLHVTSTRDVWTGARETWLSLTRTVGHEGGYVPNDWVACRVPEDALSVGQKTRLEVHGVRCEGTATQPPLGPQPLVEVLDLSLVVVPAAGRSHSTHEDGEWTIGQARYSTKSKRRAWTAVVTEGSSDWVGCEAVVAEQRFTQVKKDR